MKTMLALTLILSVLDAFATSRFYPQSTLVKFQDEKTNDAELRSEIFSLGEKIHAIHSNSADTLHDVCPENANCIQQRRDMNYTEARQIMFGELFLEDHGKGKYTLKEVYCNIELDQTKGVGPGKIPNSSFVNCEHTWPQSKFSKQFPSELQKSDLHHLFPSDMRANSTRSNYPFAEVVGKFTNNDCQDSQIGFAIDDHNVKSFEPPREHKGNVARALFYFSTRYKIKIDDLQAKYLKVWSEEDPVDEEETARNEKIMKLQGNRNPFIDYPELINRLY